MKDIFSSIPYFDSVEEYNFRINISPPRYDNFDIRNFEENMKTVKLNMYPFRISFFQIALLESGGGFVNSEGEAYHLENFTLFFNLPGQIIYWNIPRNWKGYYVCMEESFYTSQIDGYSRLYDLPFFKSRTPAIKLKEEEARIILDMMKQMDKEYQNPSPHSRHIIKSYLSTILAYCIRFFERDFRETQIKNNSSSLSQRFKDLVHQHVKALALNNRSDTITVSACAGELFITPKHLSGIVKKDLGVTPTAYIHGELIHEAQKLLHTTCLQIKEIAYLLGFSDPSYFHRLFKKLTSVSPARYRDSL